MSSGAGHLVNNAVLQEKVRVLEEKARSSSLEISVEDLKAPGIFGREKPLLGKPTLKPEMFQALDAKIQSAEQLIRK